MDERQLRCFAATFEAGSLTGASEKLRIATSALSHHIANLESGLGVILFERKPRGMEPTASGHRLYEHARHILKALEAAESDVREAGGNIAGAVSVGMAYSAVKSIGVALAQRVLLDYPGIELAISESLSGATLMHLMMSEVDLALVYNPPRDAQLRSRPVLEEQMILIGKREIIGTSDAAITFDQILDLPIILLRQGVSARAIMDDVNLLKKIEARARPQLNSVQAITGSLEAGLGCVIGTNLFMREQLANGTLHARPIVEPNLSRTLYLCELVSRRPTYALEAVRSLMLNLVSQAVRDGRWDAKLIAQN